MEKFDYGEHRIIQGDSLEVLPNEVLDNSIDLIFVDPPYNIGKNFNGQNDKWATDEDYLNWCYKWIDCKRRFIHTSAME